MAHFGGAARVASTSFAPTGTSPTPATPLHSPRCSLTVPIHILIDCAVRHTCALLVLRTFPSAACPSSPDKPSSRHRHHCRHRPPPTRSESRPLLAAMNGFFPRQQQQQQYGGDDMQS